MICLQKKKSCNCWKRYFVTDLKAGYSSQRDDFVRTLPAVQNSLRDVLKWLALESYIDIYPKKGNIVSYIDLESVEQIIYLRSALEKEIMKELSSQIALSDVQKLSDILDRQRAVIEEDHATDQFQFDDQFHQTMFQLVGRGFFGISFSSRMFTISDIASCICWKQGS